MSIGLLLAGAAVVVAASSKDDKPKGLLIVNPAVFTPPPQGDVLTGGRTAQVTTTNGQGTIGGLVPFTQKGVPNVRIPTAGIIGKAVVGVATSLIDLAAQWTGGNLFPDQWTEPDGQMFELGAMLLPDAGAVVAVEVKLQARMSTKSPWKTCRVVKFGPTMVETSRVLDAGEPPVTPPGQKTLTECKYSRADYKALGFNWSNKVMPRPEAPRRAQLHLQVTPEAGKRRLGIYLWMPPRLGLHRFTAKWRVERPAST